MTANMVEQICTVCCL